MHNICKDKAKSKLTLFRISLAKQLIPDSLRLGDTFFTHMTVFGTYSKEDGEMPLHYDENDVISCVFHLGEVFRGGSTVYYDGVKPKDLGKLILEVPFRHGTLQIGIFKDILHGVRVWNGHRCGIQLNLKKKVLEHFVSYGDKFFKKYHNNGYSGGPFIALG